GFRAEPVIQRQLRTHTPVVLKISCKVRPFLADEAKRVNLAAIDVAEQERRKGVATARGETRIAGKSCLLGRVRRAPGYALAAIAVVVIALIHTAGFEGMFALDPGQVVVERVNRIFRSIVGLPAPGGVALAEVELQQILVAVHDAYQAYLVLPVIAAENCGLRR